MRELGDVHGLTAADVMHRRLTTVPASTTVGELRDYFAAGASRRLALVVDGQRYVGAIASSDLPEEADAAASVAAHARLEPMIDPRAAAAVARDAALDQPSLRLPVVDESGTLVGVVAIDGERKGFCGT